MLEFGRELHYSGAIRFAHSSCRTARTAPPSMIELWTTCNGGDVSPEICAIHARNIQGSSASHLEGLISSNRAPLTAFTYLTRDSAKSYTRSSPLRVFTRIFDRRRLVSQPASQSCLTMSNSAGCRLRCPSIDQISGIIVVSISSKPAAHQTRA